MKLTIELDGKTYGVSLTPEVPPVTTPFLADDALRALMHPVQVNEVVRESANIEYSDIRSLSDVMSAKQLCSPTNSLVSTYDTAFGVLIGLRIAVKRLNKLPSLPKASTLSYAEIKEAIQLEFARDSVLTQSLECDDATELTRLKDRLERLGRPGGALFQANGLITMFKIVSNLLDRLAQDVPTASLPKASYSEIIAEIEKSFESDDVLGRALARVVDSDFNGAFNATEQRVSKVMHLTKLTDNTTRYTSGLLAGLKIALDVLTKHAKGA